MSIVTSIDSPLAITREAKVTVVLAPSSSNVLVNFAPLTTVLAWRVKQSGADVTYRIGETTEAANDLILGDVRDNMVVTQLYLSSTVGATVVLELQGR